LSSLKDEREDIHIEGFYDQLVVPEDELLVSLPTLPETATAAKDIDQLIAGLHGTQQHYAYFLTPTCSITMLQSPYTTSMISEPPAQAILPTEAKAQLDFRLVPAQDPYDIFNKLQRHLQQHGHKQIQTRLLTACAPAAPSVNEPLLAIARQAFQTTYNADPVIFPLGALIPSFIPLRQHLALPTIAITPPYSHPYEPPIGAAAEFARFAKGIALILANFASMAEKGHSDSSINR
jgi:acetylornithine deacetylase/succinyl-diaminopimelate desuccinylase-like protein